MPRATHLTEIVPGGVLPTDYWHRVTNDGTCSRCRREVPDEDVPLRLWRHNGRDMLIYCEACIDFARDKHPTEAP